VPDLQPAQLGRQLLAAVARRAARTECWSPVRGWAVSLVRRLPWPRTGTSWWSSWSRAAGGPWPASGVWSAWSAACASGAIPRRSTSVPGNQAAPSSPSSGVCPARSCTGGRAWRPSPGCSPRKARQILHHTETLHRNSGQTGQDFMIVETCRSQRGKLSSIPMRPPLARLPLTQHPTRRKLTLFWNYYRTSRVRAARCAAYPWARSGHCTRTDQYRCSRCFTAPTGSLGQTSDADPACGNLDHAALSARPQSRRQEMMFLAGAQSAATGGPQRLSG